MKNIKRTVLFCAVFLCISFVCKAQLWDDFTDGDLTNNPVWLGNTDSFRVNSSFELQLNASAAGKAYLALPMSLLNEDMEWRFWIRENFAPSANNFARFYLTSDREDLSDTA
ncbi:MAG: hypothetical protein LBQ64_04535, partial [Bacteroidales bacterium]|nr:hypothetical protein [Bacteroidales bacterium]